MRDGEGEVRFRADVVRADTVEVIRRSQDFHVRFTDRRRSTLVVIRLKDITYPLRVCLSGRILL
jgi:hypothetical protein